MRQFVDGKWVGDPKQIADAEAAAPKPTMMLTAHKAVGKLVCNECFNELPSADRGGRGARGAGWAPSDTPKEDCAICGRSMLIFEDH